MRLSEETLRIADGRKPTAAEGVTRIEGDPLRPAAIHADSSRHPDDVPLLRENRLRLRPRGGTRNPREELAHHGRRRRRPQAEFVQPFRQQFAN